MDYFLINIEQSQSWKICVVDKLGNRSRDEKWYEDNLKIEWTLAHFLCSNNLLIPTFILPNQPTALKIKFSDLNENGKLFAKSGAIRRWYNSIDRSKKADAVTNQSYLERSLKKILQDI
jgi:hypothetical protein